LLYNVSGGTAAKFHRAGFKRIPDLLAVGVDEIAVRLKMDREAAGRLAMRAHAWAQRRPIALKPPTFPSGLPIYYYDIETFGQVTYLHGAIRVEGAAREERQFVAESPDQEGAAWHQFLDWLARDQRAVVWCWADYERGFVESLWSNYGGNQRGYDLLHTSLTDQCAFVSEHFALPATSYSIKQVAPLFGFHWDASDAGGLNSEAWYREWLNTKDRALLKKILRYNLDDVVAMEVVDRALGTLAAVGGQP
jgi:predicted RecB family nuclease